MTRQYPLSPTTHTLEMDQLAALNAALRDRDPTLPITAADLELVCAPVLGESVDGQRQLPAEAVLDRLCYEGPPDYPYIHAHFRGGTSDAPSAPVELHTHALRLLSRLLHLHENWGTGSDDNPPLVELDLLRMTRPVGS